MKNNSNQRNPARTGIRGLCRKLIALVIIMLLAAPAFGTTGVYAATYTADAPAVTVNNDTRGITVTWTESAGAEYYVVLRKTETATAYSKKAVIPAGQARMWTDTAVTSGKVYTYKVRCADVNGKYTSTNSNEEACFCIFSRTPTLKLTGTGVQVSWGAIANVDRYHIYRKGPGDSSFQLYAEAPKNKTSWTDNSVKNGETYVYTIGARKSYGSRMFLASNDASRYRSITFNTPPEMLGIEQEGKNLKLNWNAVEGAQAYTVLRSVNGGSWTKKAVLPADQTEWTDTSGKTSGREYSYVIRCSTSDSTAYTSARSEELSIYYLKTPTIQVSDSYDGVILETKIVKCTEYVEFYRADPDYTDVVLIDTIRNDDNAASITCVDATAQPDTDYVYFVTAHYKTASVSAEAPVFRHSASITQMYAGIYNVNLRTEPNAESDLITVPYMTPLLYLDTYSESAQGSWLRVSYENAIYYVWQDADGEAKLTETKRDASFESVNMYVDEVLQNAVNIYQYQDTVYRRGDSTGIADENGQYGYDCSGFVSAAIQNAIRREVPVYDYFVRVDEMYKAGVLYNAGLPGEFSVQDIPFESMRAGDIIFFNLSAESGDETEQPDMPNHVGIYLGSGQFLHCTHYDEWGGDGVFLMPLDSYYTAAVVCVKRFIPDNPRTADVPAYIDGYKVNLRAGNSVDADIVTTAYGGEEVTVLYTNDAWAYVTYNGANCFVSMNNITFERPSEETETMFVAAVKQKLYTEPTTDSDHILAYFGRELEYAGRLSDSNYYKVILDGSTYYIYSKDGIGGILASDLGPVYESGNPYRVKSGTNLREIPETGDNIIRMVSRGETVTVIVLPGSGSTWCFVKTENGESGFLNFNSLEPITAG